MKKNDDLDSPPPLPEEVAKENSKENPLTQMGIKDWSPPSEAKLELYEFFFIEKSSKNVAFRGFDRHNFERYKKLYNDHDYISIECVNKEIINQPSKFTKRYSKLINKIYEDRNNYNNINISSELCYQLYGGLLRRQEKNSKK